ncbi:MAG: hypothetical protein LBI84_06170 [Propionibacteriaceae bacterium]|nr:hypothetical protein [Propionibacteriaceae bacterium]
MSHDPIDTAASPKTAGDDDQARPPVSPTLPVVDLTAATLQPSAPPVASSPASAAASGPVQAGGASAPPAGVPAQAPAAAGSQRPPAPPPGRWAPVPPRVIPARSEADSTPSAAQPTAPPAAPAAASTSGRPAPLPVVQVTAAAAPQISRPAAPAGGLAPIPPPPAAAVRGGSAVGPASTPAAGSPASAPAASDPAPAKAAQASPASAASPAAAAGALPAAGGLTVPAPTGVIAPVEPAVPAAGSEAAKARSARARALGEVAPTPDVIAAPAKIGLPTQYNKFPSFVLLLLRLSTAALMGIRCFRDAEALSATKQLWANTVLNDTLNPDVLAWIQVAAEGAIALLLLFGLGVRVVGAALMVLGVAWLVFVLWGAVSPFQTGIPGFTGEFEILLVAVGFLFLGVGGGGWLSLDAFFHRARVERKNAKAA